MKQEIVGGVDKFQLMILPNNELLVLLLWVRGYQLYILRV